MPSASLSIATIRPGRERQLVAAARRLRQHAAGRVAHARVAALRRDDLAEHLERAAVGEHLLDLRAALGRVLRDAAEHEHLGAEHVGQLAGVDRAAAAQHLDRLADLERVADRAADRRVHVGQHARDRLAGARRRSRASARTARARRSIVFMNAPLADLAVEHEAVDALGELLRHDRRRDQRQRLDRRRSRRAARTAACRPARSARSGRSGTRRARRRARRNRSTGQVDAEPGDRLELVERAAGVAEAAARHHRHRDAARGDRRRERDRDLVADAAGRVLVDLRAARSLDRSITSPERVIASAHVASSRSSRPRKKIAISIAATW